MPNLEKENLELQQKVESLRQTLNDMIDYHHFIGNEDCPVTHNEVLVTLYKMAQAGLRTKTNA